MLEPESFDPDPQNHGFLMPEVWIPDMLNRKRVLAGARIFPSSMATRTGLNAGLRHLLLLGWRSQRTGKVLGDAVALHPAVRQALKLLSEGEWEHDLGHWPRLAE